jgi:AraC-like DNA-binding protein
MFHLKGNRFGMPLIQRYGVLNHNMSYPISQNSHSGIEIHYVLRGEVTWKIEGIVTPLRVSGGYFGIIPAKTIHRAVENNATPATRIGVIFNPNPSSCTMGTPFLAEEIEQMFAKITSCQAHSHRISTRLAAILREIADSLNMKAANDSKQLMRLRVLSSYLVHETCRILDNPEVLAIGHDVIPKIRKWIDEHLSEDIPVERLVSFSGYGRSRFYTLFMADTGLSPNDYILRKRIIKAKKLLLSRKPSISMAEISAQCGFNSPSAFAKSFRKIVGKSPREFAHTVN